jgi:hypothetical protein
LKKGILFLTAGLLLAAALDDRFALTFPTCSGEMGASLSRRERDRCSSLVSAQTIS